MDLVDLLLHVDEYLLELVENYGVWIYAILFLIVFAETGLVVTPFLPGDSLLFAAGALGADRRARRPRRRGHADRSRPIARQHGELRDRPVGRTRGSFSWRRPTRDGGAGSIRRTSPGRTRSSSGTAARRSSWRGSCRSSARSCRSSPASPRCRTRRSPSTTWPAAWPGSAICVGAGYVFGNVPIVKENFSLVAIGIVIVSLLPMVVEFVRIRRRAPQVRLERHVVSSLQADPTDSRTQARYASDPPAAATTRNSGSS